jgi:hypothetical protein
MNITVIYTERPKCKNCGKEMKDWNIFSDEHEHEHVNCIADRISDSIMKVINEQFSKIKK